MRDIWILAAILLVLVIYDETEQKACYPAYENCGYVEW